MIGGAHYEDERLVELLWSDTNLDSDEHLIGCEDCRTRLDSFRMVAGVLRDTSVWDDRPLNEDPIPATIANLRAYADQMTAEDAAASVAIEALLATPSSSWSFATLPPTAGTVRKLIEASEHAIDTLPTEAVTLASLATTLAESLTPTMYVSDTVARLRGAAHRQHAYALFYTGSFADADKAICASERHFNEALVDEYELARVGIVRALVDRALEKYERAIRVARGSARSFALFEDVTRSASARLAAIHLLFSVGRFDTAYEALNHLKRQLEGTSDLGTYARVVANLGHCCWSLGRTAESLLYHDTAAKLFNELGIRSDALREECSVARVLAHEGQLEEALSRFLALRTELRQFGMMASAIQADLEAAEILVTHGDFDRVEEICRAAMRLLEDAKLSYTEPALTALSLIREAARSRTATSALVVRVRHYLDRVPREPALLFALAPE